MSRLLTAREVGERLGLSTESVLRRWRRGELPFGYRLGSNVLRFDPDGLAAWLEERRGGSKSRGATLPALESRREVP
jgi:predicted DNA-binding transcriptional regulator AlpA